MNSRANTVAEKMQAMKGQPHGASKTTEGKRVRPHKRGSDHRPTDATLDYPQLG